MMLRGGDDPSLLELYSAISLLGGSAPPRPLEAGTVRTAEQPAFVGPIYEFGGAPFQRFEYSVQVNKSSGPPVSGNALFVQ